MYYGPFTLATMLKLQPLISSLLLSNSNDRRPIGPIVLITLLAGGIVVGWLLRTKLKHEGIYSWIRRIWRNMQTRLPVVLPRGSTKENVLQNKRWLGLAKECVDLFDELERLIPDLDSPRQEMAQHVESRLEEILTRSGVEMINNDAVFDQNRHRLAVSRRAVAPGTPISETVSPGFAIGRRVLRPARVRVDNVSAGRSEQNVE
jgi:GrpE